MKLFVLRNGEHYPCRYADLSRVKSTFDNIRIIEVPLLKLAYIIPKNISQFKELIIC